MSMQYIETIKQQSGITAQLEEQIGKAVEIFKMITKNTLIKTLRIFFGGKMMMGSIEEENRGGETRSMVDLLSILTE